MQYYWSGLLVYIKDYCKSCTTCSHAKPVRHKPYGLLKQLPIPEKPWNSISMYFIEKLPPSSSYTSILVIVDRLSKQSLFILTHDTITSQQLTTCAMRLQQPQPIQISMRGRSLVSRGSQRRCRSYWH